MLAQSGKVSITFSFQTKMRKRECKTMFTIRAAFTRATATQDFACRQQRAYSVTGSSSRQHNWTEIVLFGSPALDASVQGRKLRISSLNEIQQTNFVRPNNKDQRTATFRRSKIIFAADSMNSGRAAAESNIKGRLRLIL